MQGLDEEKGGRSRPKRRTKDRPVLESAPNSLARGPSRLADFVDSIWGHDVFIAHRRSDGAAYAARLFAALKRNRVAAFIDRKIYLPGDSLSVNTRRHAARSTMLVLLLTPGIAVERQVDWVEAEIDAYLETHAAEPRVLVIDFADAAVPADHPIRQKVAQFIYIAQNPAALLRQPGSGVVKSILAQLQGRRRDTARLRLFQGIAAGLAVLLVLLGVLAVGFFNERNSARANERRGLAAAAESTLGGSSATDTVTLALAAWPRQDGPGELFLQSALSTLSRALREEVLPTHLTAGASFSGLAFSADGQRLVTWNWDYLQVWQPATGELLLTTRVEAFGPPPYNAIFGAMLSSAGDRVAAWGPGGTICQWDVATGAPLPCCDVANSFLNGAAYDKAERRLLAWSEDGTVSLIDAATCARSSFWVRQEGAVKGARFSADETKVLVWSGDLSLSLWNVASNSLVGPPMKWNGFGDPFFVAGDTRVVSSDLSMATLWDPATGRALLSENPVSTLQSSGGDGSERLLLRSLAGLQFHDVVSGRPVGPELRHEGFVQGVSFAQDAPRLLSWDDHNVLHVWDTETSAEVLPPFQHDEPLGGGELYAEHNRILSWAGSTLNVWDATSGELLARSTFAGTIGGAALSPDGRRVLSWVDKVLYLTDPADGRRLGPRMTQRTAVMTAFFSGDSRVLSLSTEGVSYLWNVAIGSEVASLSSASGTATGATFNADGSRVLAWSDAGELWLWNQATDERRELQASGAGLFGAAFDPDGTRVVSWARDGSVKVWDAASGAPVGPGMSHAKAAYGAMFNRAGDRVLSWSEDGSIMLWDVLSGAVIGKFEGEMPIYRVKFSGDESLVAFSTAQHVYVWNPATSSIVEPDMRAGTEADVEANGLVTSLAFRANDSQLAFTSKDRMDTVASLRVVSVLDGALIRKMEVPPNGSSRAILDDAGRRAALANGTRLELWDVEAGGQIGAAEPRTTDGSGDGVDDVAFSADARRLYGWSYPGIIRTWDASSAQRIGVAIETGEDISGLVDAHDGSRLLTWHGDRLRLWDTATAEQLGPDMVTVGDVVGAAFSPDGTRVLSWSRQGRIALWDVDWPPGNLIGVACGLLPTHDVTSTSKQFGFVASDPICTAAQIATMPDWSRIERKIPPIGAVHDVSYCAELPEASRNGPYGTFCLAPDGQIDSRPRAAVESASPSPRGSAAV